MFSHTIHISMIPLITPPRNRGGVIFSLQFVCVSVCVCVYVSVRTFLWTKFQPNGCTNLDAVFFKWMPTALARTLLKLSVNLSTLYLSSLMFDQNWWNSVCRLDIHLLYLCLNFIKGIHNPQYLPNDFFAHILSWMIWSLLTSTCRFKYAPRPLNQRLDKSKYSKT